VCRSKIYKKIWTGELVTRVALTKYIFTTATSRQTNFYYNIVQCLDSVDSYILTRRHRTDTYWLDAHRYRSGLYRIYLYLNICVCIKYLVRVARTISLQLAACTDAMRISQIAWSVRRMRYYYMHCMHSP
jgi:hypothetical protein